jgi:ABC-type enterochelin transport system permease subunit
MKRRSRKALAAKLAMVIAIGLMSRLLGQHTSPLIGKHLGDVLWAMMFVLITLIIRPRTSTPIAAFAGLAIVAAIEFLKLYHSLWIDTVRAIPVAGFLLGRVFQWSNFVSYAIGTCLGAFIADR